jgi:hypothetical protein
VTLSHRMETADPGTMVVMRNERATRPRSWELQVFSETVRVVGFDPTWGDSLVNHVMNPWPEVKSTSPTRVNGRIALGATAEPTPPDSDFDETGKRRRNRPSARKRAAMAASGSPRAPRAVQLDDEPAIKYTKPTPQALPAGPARVEMKPNIDSPTAPHPIYRQRL